MQTTDRLPSGFVDTAAPSLEQVREDVARAIWGLQSLHAEIGRRRRETDALDRELEEMEAALTGRVGTVAAMQAPAVNGITNGVHGHEVTTESTETTEEDEIGGVWGEDPELEGERWGIPDAVGEAVVGLMGLAGLITQAEAFPGEDAAVIAEFEAHTEATASTDTRGGELDAAAPGELGAEPGHEAPIRILPEIGPAPWTKEAMRAVLSAWEDEDWPLTRDVWASDDWIKGALGRIPRLTGKSGIPPYRYTWTNDPPVLHYADLEYTIDLTGDKLVKLVRDVLAIPDGGAATEQERGPNLVDFLADGDGPGAEAAARIRDLWLVEDWRSISIANLLVGVAADKVIAILDDMAVSESETLEDLAHALSEDDVLEDFLIKGDAALLRARLANFRALRGWDNETVYPDGIPVSWIAAKEGDGDEDGVTDAQLEWARERDEKRAETTRETIATTDLTAAKEETWCKPGRTSPRDREVQAMIADWRARQKSGDTEPRWDRWSEFSVTARLASGGVCIVKVLYEPAAKGDRTSHIDFHYGIMDKRYRSHFLDPSDDRKDIRSLTLEKYCLWAARHLLVADGHACEEPKAAGMAWRTWIIDLLKVSDADRRALSRAGLFTLGDVWDSWLYFGWNTIGAEKMPSHVCLERAERAIRAVECEAGLKEIDKRTAKNETAASRRAKSKPAPAPKKPAAKPAPAKLTSAAAIAKPFTKRLPYGTFAHEGKIVPGSVMDKFHAALVGSPPWAGWAKLQRDGATDDELKAAMGKRFGSGAVPAPSPGKEWSARGGDNPRFWATAGGATGRRTPTLVGDALLNAARELLSIKRVVDTAVKEMKPAAGGKSKAKTPGRLTYAAATMAKLKEALLKDHKRTWDRLRAHGANDALIKAKIGEVFGLQNFRHGDDGGYTTHGGTDPRFFDDVKGYGAPKGTQIGGNVLIEMTREVLGLEDNHEVSAPKKPPAPKKVKMRVAPAAGWNRAELTSAAKDLVGRVGDTSKLMVCQACQTLFHEDAGTLKPCPECGEKKAASYSLTLELISGGLDATVSFPPVKRDRADEILADASHGFAPVSKAKPTPEVTFVSGNDRDLRQALQLEHPHWAAEWKKLQDLGATNAEILGLLKRQWPFSPVFTAPPKGSATAKGFTVQGGKMTGFFFGVRKGLASKPDLHGNDLAAAVRRVLDIKPSATKGKSPRASGAARRAKAKGASTSSRPGVIGFYAAQAAKPDDHFVPLPHGGWSITKMGEAAREILGETHRESMRDAKLVCCLTCKAMYARGLPECPPCASKEFVSYAFIRAKVLGDGKRAVDRELAAARDSERE